MSTPIDSQLREYTAFFESQLPVIALDEIITARVANVEADVCEACGSDLTVFDLRGPDESPEPRPRKRRAAVLAVAAAVLLMAGVVVVADRNDSNVETAPVSSATTPEPVPSPTPPEPTPPPEEAGPPPSVVDSLGYRWSLVALDYALFGPGFGFDGMRDVTVGAPGLVAVGRSGSGAVVWTSVDGSIWSRVPDEEALLGGAGLGMESVTVGGPGLVAVGGHESFLRGPGGDAVVWTSVDGVTWSRVPHDEAVFGGAWMGSVTAGGPGLVAVGGRPTGEDTYIPIEQAMVWTSVDGVTWTGVPHDEAIFGGAGMSSVTAGGPGLVAVGSSGEHAVVWTSVDGVTWWRVPHDEAVFGVDSLISSVTAGGPGLVAVGQEASDTGGDAVVWTSIDGTTWSKVPRDDAVLGGAGEQEMRHVTTGGPGLVAVGMEGYCHEPECQPSPNGYVPVVWTSVDGITWSRVPHDETVFGQGESPNLHSATAGGPGLVAVGSGGVIVAEPIATPED